MNDVLVDGVPMDYSGLFPKHRVTLRSYIEHGYQPGSAWTAILRNDLSAVLMVDEHTLQELPQIYRWLVNHAPSNCWGSTESVAQWIRARREAAE